MIYECGFDLVLYHCMIGINFGLCLMLAKVHRHVSTLAIVFGVDFRRKEVDFLVPKHFWPPLRMDLTRSLDYLIRTWLNVPRKLDVFALTDPDTPHL